MNFDLCNLENIKAFEYVWLVCVYIYIYIQKFDRVEGPRRQVMKILNFEHAYNLSKIILTRCVFKLQKAYHTLGHVWIIDLYYNPTLCKLQPPETRVKSDSLKDDLLFIMVSFYILKIFLKNLYFFILN